MVLGKVYKELLSSGRVRLAAEALYESPVKGGAKEVFYFDFPAEIADSLVDRGDPWLVLFLPISTVLGESLHITRPVDPLLLEGCLELLEIWHAWMPYLPVIEVRADNRSPVEPGGTKTGSFFSGGVDSLYSLLQHENHPKHCRAEKIDDLITIFGIYSREKGILENSQGFSGERSLGFSAESLKKKRVFIHTNLHQTRFNRTNSLLHSYNCALAAPILALGKRYSRMLIPSSTSYAASTRLGTNALTDRLLSTTAMRFIPDGSRHSRREKLDYLATHDCDISVLRVCSRDPDLMNCSRCAKCVRTMLLLHVLGKLDRCTLFREPALDLERVSGVYCSTDELKGDFEHAGKEAFRLGMSNVEKAVTAALFRSAWIDNARRVIWKIRARQRLGSHELKLLIQLIGYGTGYPCSLATRRSLDKMLSESPDLSAFLSCLARDNDTEASKLPVPDDRRYNLLEHALVHASICESTLDLECRFPGNALSKPEARFDSVQWLYWLGLLPQSTSGFGNPEVGFYE